jgi:CRP-like cAMP-binding protein
MQANYDQNPNVFSLPQNSASTEQFAKKESIFPKEIHNPETIDKSHTSILVKIFYGNIGDYTTQKKFKKTKHLKGERLNIAPMDRTIIAGNVEAIERERDAVLDFEKMKPFAELLKQFSKKEAAAFFSALVHQEIKAYMPVFQQYQFDDQLYFIQSGCFILSYYDNETHRNIDFATLQKGDIAGAETFFSLSIQTTTLTPIEDSSLSVLKKSTFKKILSDNPSIESTLKHFCCVRKKNSLIGCSEGQTRQNHNRYR